MNLFFDLDGTLTDPKLGITRCVQYALERLDHPVPEADDLEWCIGPPLRQNFVELVGEVLADEGVQLYRERFAEVGLFENVPYEGIHSALEALQAAGFGMYVASSKAQVFVDRILDKFELAPFFVRAFGAELDGTRADKTELLRFALSQTQAVARKSIMIGDRSHDAVGALNNAMMFVGVLYGYGSRDELSQAGAAVLVNDPATLSKQLLVMQDG